MSLWQIGETIRLSAAITDIANDEVDPTTVKITVNKPDGSEAVESDDMTKSAIGSYYYDYLIPNNNGTFNWKVTATGSAGRISIAKRSFNAESST